jgi:hypothetical protein
MKVSYYELHNEVVIIKEFSMKTRFDSILIIVDKLIKYMMFISFKETVTASILSYTILRELISNHELLKNLLLTETSCSQASSEKCLQQNSE